MHDWHDRLMRAMARLLFRSVKERRGVYQKLAQFTRDGMAPNDAISKIHRRYAKREHSFAIMLNDWRRAMPRGQSLAGAISPWIPPGEAVIIAAGESTGHLPEALDEAVGMTEKRKELKDTVRKHLRETILYWALFLGAVTAISRYLAPQIASSQPRSTWPLSATVYFDTLHVLSIAMPYLVAVILAVGAWAAWSSPRWTGRWRTLADRIPPWSVYRSVEGAWVLIALSAMMRRSIAPKEALERIRLFSAPYVRSHLTTMARRLEAGQAEGDALNTGLFSEDVADDIIDYQDSAGFAAAIDSLGRNAVESTTETVATTSAALSSTAQLALYGLFFWTVASIAGMALSSFQTIQL